MESVKYEETQEVTTCRMQQGVFEWFIDNFMLLMCGVNYLKLEYSVM